MKSIRILHFIPGFLYGGIESRFLDWYELIDKEKVQFDLLIQTDSNNSIFDNFKEKGGNVYQVPPLSISTIQKHINFLKVLFNENQYSAVHCHSADKSYFVLSQAEKAGINVRILHARTSSFSGGGDLVVRNLFKKLSLSRATNYFAVSEVAGEWLFGKRNIEEVEIIKNAVVSDKFIFDNKIRSEIRRKYKLKTSDILIGHVGRFTYAKNHLFLLDIFKEVNESKSEAKLVLVGDGPYLDAIKSKAKKLGIQDNIIFIGYSDKPEIYYHAMDVFLFPSRYEGLPGSLIEAQISDLNCLISDSITKEAIFLDSTKSLSINKSSKEWAEVISSLDFNRKRTNNAEKVKSAGYDLENVVKSLEKFYLKGF